MKKLLITTLLVSGISIFSQSASAANSNLLFGGYSFGEDNSYTYFGGAKALNGDLEKDGALLRVGGGYGQYNYATPEASFGNNVRGEVSSADLMLGYNRHFTQGAVTLFAGGNYDNYKLNRGDNSNRVTGGKPGGKVQLEALFEPIKQISIINISNYTSVFNAYWSQTVIGYNFVNLTFGPEITFLGNRVFNQQKFGGRISNIKLGIVNLYISGGFLKSSGLAGDEGAYTAIGFASKF